MLNEAVTVDKWTAPRQVDNWKNINFSGMWKNSIEFFRISLFVPVVYKWLKSCAKKAHFPYPIEILFLNLCGSSVSHLFFWYLYRLWPIATSKTSSLTEWIPLRTILLYQWSFLIIPKVPSACIERFDSYLSSYISLHMDIRYSLRIHTVLPCVRIDFPSHFFCIKNEMLYH